MRNKANRSKRKLFLCCLFSKPTRYINRTVYRDKFVDKIVWNDVKKNVIKIKPVTKFRTKERIKWKDPEPKVITLTVAECRKPRVNFIFEFYDAVKKVYKGKKFVGDKNGPPRILTRDGCPDPKSKFCEAFC